MIIRQEKAFTYSFVLPFMFMNTTQFSRCNDASLQQVKMGSSLLHSLSYHGALFLDEFGEWNLYVLETSGYRAEI